MGGGSFKSQLKRADKSQAFYAIIIGTGRRWKIIKWVLKPLRNNEAQVNVSFEDIVTEVKKIFG